MQRTTHPVIDIINDHAATADLNNHTIKKLSRLKACYEQSLGHHVLACQDCGKQHLIPNTCKGLHCPFCSYVKTQKWIARRTEELVDCRYFHNVFTLPHEFNYLFKNNFKVMANMLFKAVSYTLQTFSKNGRQVGKRGFMLFLHTWDQRLGLHFHIHALIAGGSLSKSGQWRSLCEPDSKYLFPVLALCKVFRGKFIELFNQAYIKARKSTIE